MREILHFIPEYSSGRLQTIYFCASKARMEELLNKAAASLRKAALNEKAKTYILNDKIVFSVLKKAANRYIGGESLEETIEKVRVQNLSGFKCGIEYMGENTLTAAEANEATMEFQRACAAIASYGLDAAISLDLSHIGLSVSRQLCMENLYSICESAAQKHIEVTISAEGTDKTDAVLNTYFEASKSYNNLSVTLQAYLHRTKDDFQEAIKRSGRIRLVKGAFETPPGLSLQRGADLNERYLDYLSQLLGKGHRCSVATHDSYIQCEASKLIELYQVDQHLYEFESLYGIQGEQLAALRDQGHPAKVYFVYGKEWYLYLCNRIAEHPLNLFTALTDIVEYTNKN